MKHSIRILMLGYALVGLPACASPYPSHYSAEAIEAKVIDADTKKPIEGVIVTASWQLLGGMEGSLPIGQMQVMETQTGSDGVFRFPAWGPLKRPKATCARTTRSCSSSSPVTSTSASRARSAPRSITIPCGGLSGMGRRLR